ncbi:alpha-amylase family glycosyl hydrolase [Salinimicrobium soli]|uniref:alpha-amylase family glycosyl hydrolase n=1 Tax=Salinimicrobium soli TaxID=1254399 RepID=UPI003AB0838F
MNRKDTYLWWQKEIIYQIYPRSFYDSSGNGTGDLNGILQKLDYLEELGVKGIWISPFFPSPMADFGYDVSDYTGIHPLIGNMDDFDRLLEGIHKRGMKMILDFVPNHSSDEHPWFQESKSSRDNPKRDWYVWKDPKPDGSEPNNWLSEFGGSAWTLDENTGQYYLHTYLDKQPDLNWRNPEVHEAMLNCMRFWLDKGVDGFRVDVMWQMIKDKQFRDNPPNPDYTEDMSPYDKLLPVYSSDQPEVHDVVREMRKLTDQYPETVLIGEIYLPIQDLVTYYGHDLQGAQLPFNFQLVELPWEARRIEAAINEYEASLPSEGWPNWVLGNHDKSRIASRVGPQQARIAAMLLLTLKGTPTMYYGDEIGMTDVHIPVEMANDPRETKVPGKGLGRDPERTPMQWDSSENAGFTNGKPWLPLMENYKKFNVASESKDQDSMLNFYRRLIKLRASEKALSVGDFYPVPAEGNVLAYRREGPKKAFLIILNLGDQKEQVDPELPQWKGTVRFSTHSEKEGKEIKGSLILQPDEGLLIELKQ